MKNLWVPALIVLTLGGFAVVKIATAKKTAEADYRANIHTGEGGWFADIMSGAKKIETIGPLPTEEEAAQQAATYLAGKDVVAFYTLHSYEETAGQPVWFFDGWSRGTKVVEAEGPYKSSTIANAAGTAWAKKMAGEK